MGELVKSKPIVDQETNDDGTHSNWVLIDADTGIKLWSEDLNDYNGVNHFQVETNLNKVVEDREYIENLKPIEEHNKEVSERTFQYKGKLFNTKLNGLKCPECGHELCDTNPFETLLTYPGQKRVACSNCDYTGTRYV